MLGTAPEWRKLCRSRIYLNAAGRTPLPLSSLRAGEEAVPRKAVTPWSIGDSSAERDAVRELFANILGDGVASEEVAVVPSTSYAMSLAARALRLRLTPSRAAVLVLHGQNHSNVMPWQAFCASAGSALAIVQPGANSDWTTAVVARLAIGDIAICAVPPCHWCVRVPPPSQAGGRTCAPGHL